MFMENKCRWKSFLVLFFFLRVLQVNTKHSGEYFYVSSLGNPQTADYQAAEGCCCSNCFPSKQTNEKLGVKEICREVRYCGHGSTGNELHVRLEECGQDCKICFHLGNRNVLKKKEFVTEIARGFISANETRLIWDRFSREKWLSEANFPFCDVLQVQISPNSHLDITADVL